MQPKQLFKGLLILKWRILEIAPTTKTVRTKFPTTKESLTVRTEKEQSSFGFATKHRRNLTNLLHFFQLLLSIRISQFEHRFHILAVNASSQYMHRNNKAPTPSQAVEECDERRIDGNSYQAETSYRRRYLWEKETGGTWLHVVTQCAEEVGTAIANKVFFDNRSLQRYSSQKKRRIMTDDAEEATIMVHNAGEVWLQYAIMRTILLHPTANEYLRFQQGITKKDGNAETRIMKKRSNWKYCECEKKRSMMYGRRCYDCNELLQNTVKNRNDEIRRCECCLQRNEKTGDWKCNFMICPTCHNERFKHW